MKQLSEEEKKSIMESVAKSGFKGEQALNYAWRLTQDKVNQK